MLCIPMLSLADIIIESAQYGTQAKRCDAMAKVSRQCNRMNSCSVKVDNHLCGDPHPWKKKNLKVKYSCTRDDVHKLTIFEGNRLKIRCNRQRYSNDYDSDYGYENNHNRYNSGSHYNGNRYYNDYNGHNSHRHRPGKKIIIERAKYGADGQKCDATSVIRRRCEGKKKCTIKASNRLCGDPNKGSVKHLRIKYSCGVRPLKVYVGEKNLAYLSCPGDSYNSDW